MSVAIAGTASDSFRRAEQEAQQFCYVGSRSEYSLSCLPAVGGCGTSTLVRQLCVAYPTGDGPAAVEVGLHSSFTDRSALVTSANLHGLDAVDMYLRWRLGAMPGTEIEALAGLFVVAIEDGLRGYRIEPIIRTGLRTLNQYLPVVVVPRVHRWRSDPGAPATKKYLKALTKVVSAVKEMK